MPPTPHRRHRPIPPAAAALAAGALLLTAAGSGVASASATPGPPKAHLDRAEGTSPLDLLSATFGQAGRHVHLELRTVKPFLSTVLRPGSGRSLCVRLRLDADTTPDARLCAVGDRSAASGLRLRMTTLGATGAPKAIRTLKSAVGRPDGRTVTADIPSAGIGLAVGPHAWQAYSHWQDDRACVPVELNVSPCVDRLPDDGPMPFRIRPLRVVGCAFAGARQVRHGTGNRIALSFDDGPAPITAAFLDVLGRAKVPATFFMLGRSVHGHGALLRRMLAEGHMLANHSLTHANLGGGGPGAADELRRTNEIIRQATGFTPCLFRPPYGSTSASLVATAGALHLTTVLWDVDPLDWTHPGAGAIEARAVGQARAGSIVLAHDGGGPRGQTLAALPGIIRTLKQRGYRFVTVAELLGLDLIRR